MNRPIGLGLSVREVREANQRLAAMAREAGQVVGPSFVVCRALADEGLISHCTSLGTAGYGARDQTSFELPDPARGRGVIQYIAEQREFEAVLGAAKELGTSFVANEEAHVIFLGADALSDADRDRVRSLLDEIQP